MDCRENCHWTNESFGRDAGLVTTTSTASPLAVPADGPTLTDLIAAVRHVIAMRADWVRTAILVADQLRAHLPGPGILTPGQRRGQPGRPAGHILHTETDGTFSILGLVWRPGQSTGSTTTSPGAWRASCKASS